MQEVHRTETMASRPTMLKRANGVEVPALHIRDGKGEHGWRGDDAAGANIRDVAIGAAHDLANMLQVMGFGIEQLGGESLSPLGQESVRSFRAELEYLRVLVRSLRTAALESKPRELLSVAGTADALLADAVIERASRIGALGEIARASRPQKCTYLAAWWSGMSELLHAVHGKEVVVRAQLSPKLPPVGIPADHLTQIVLNLVGNSVHAIHERVKNAPQGSDIWPAVTINALLGEDGNTVHVVVGDNGIGMNEEILTRACEPMFTTRREAGGTGLGLAMVQRLTAASGGKIGFRSQPGVGTAITLELPVLVRDSLGPVSTAGYSNGFHSAREA